MMSARKRLSQVFRSSTTWFLVAIVLLGIALRLYILARSEMIIEADEALVGLQAFGILRGETPVFYPGQTYGGSLESYLVALVFLVFGPSSAALKAVPFVFSVLFIVVTYALAARVYQRAVGLLSALFVALCPLLVSTFTLKTLGGYSQTPILGGLALILLVDLVFSEERRGTAWKAAILGFLCGLGVWNNPQFFYYLPPVILFLPALIRKAGLSGLAWFAAGGLLGALPLLLANTQPRQGTLLGFFLSELPPAEELDWCLPAAIRYFATDALTTLLGLRPIKGELTVALAIVVIPVYLAAAGVALWRMGRDLLARRITPPLVLGAALIPAPLVFLLAALTNGNWMMIIPGAGLLVRYLVPLYNFLLIFLAAFVWRLKDRSRPLAGATIAIVLAANLWSCLTVDLVDSMRCVFDNVPLPASNETLIEFLDEQDIHFAYTNHWIGYRLMFETREQVITYDYVDAERGMDRIPEYGQQLEAAGVAPAYILFNPGWERAPRLERKLRELGVGFEVKALPPLEYIVYYDLSRKVHPSEVMDALVWPWY